MYKKRSPKALALHKQEKEHSGSRLKCNIIFIFFQWVAYENNFLQRYGKKKSDASRKIKKFLKTINSLRNNTY